MMEICLITTHLIVVVPVPEVDEVVDTIQTLVLVTNNSNKKARLSAVIEDIVVVVDVDVVDEEVEDEDGAVNMIITMITTTMMRITIITMRIKINNKRAVAITMRILDEIILIDVNVEDVRITKEEKELNKLTMERQLKMINNNSNNKMMKIKAQHVHNVNDRIVDVVEIRIKVKVELKMINNSNNLVNLKMMPL